MQRILFDLPGNKQLSIVQGDGSYSTAGQSVEVALITRGKVIEPIAQVTISDLAELLADVAQDNLSKLWANELERKGPY